MSELNDRVYQAQGMVSVQAQCSLDDALALMENTAAATGVTIEYLADEIVDRRVHFDPPKLRHGNPRST